MKRDLDAQTRSEYDVLIVGGGIYGAATAWEAASRGLRTALVEKADFCSATSANSLKIIHGGFRYLQHADLRRVRESAQERRILMRIAPHLVHPLPVLVPAYGHGLKGREALTLALKLNDLLTSGRGALEDPQKQIPPGRMLSARDCLGLAPGLEREGLTGGALFSDALAHNPERLVLAYLQAAGEAGADLANYAQVTGFLQRGGRVSGARVVDRLSGDEYEVRARLVINTAGPWVGQVNGLLAGHAPAAGHGLAKAINLVLRRPLFSTETAVGIPGRNGYEDSGALARRRKSYLFVVPWRGVSMVGTMYRPFAASPQQWSAAGPWVDEEEVAEFLRLINEAYPAAKLTLEDVSYVHVGLLPADGGPGPVRLDRRYRIIDHRQEGIDGLLSVVGVKFTTARRVAQETLDLVFRRWEMDGSPSVSAGRPLPGGEISRFAEFLYDVIQAEPCHLEPDQVRDLVYNYGSIYTEVLQFFDTRDSGAAALAPKQALLRAQARYAAGEEMAVKLSDFVFRRAGLGTAGHPGEAILEEAARYLGDELGWDSARKNQELDEVRAVFAWDQGQRGER